MSTTKTRLPPRSRPAITTALASLGLTAAFGWILVVDLRLYGELPDPSLGPIALLLLAATVLAASHWRWGATVAAVVAAAVGIGSAAQPITAVRLTTPETLDLQVATILLFACALATVVGGLVATGANLRSKREPRDRR